MSTDVRNAVLESFTQIIGADAPLGMDTTPDHVTAWDSLRHVQLVNALELRLGVTFPADVLITRGRLGDLVDAAVAAMP